MSDDESLFLRAIRAAPDDTPRLIYADWLDDQGDRRADFIRAEVEHANFIFDPDDPKEDPTLHRFSELGNGLGTDWVAAVSRLSIRHCPRGSNPECPGRRELLAPRPFETLRTCRNCGEDVVFCTSEDEPSEYQFVPRHVIDLRAYASPPPVPERIQRHVETPRPRNFTNQTSSERDDRYDPLLITLLLCFLAVVLRRLKDL